MDFEFIERVVRLVEEADIGELEVESQDGLRLIVKKSSSAAPQMIPQVIAGGIPAPAAPVTEPSAAPSPAQEEIDENVEIIKAPMVGTFYCAPAPDAPPFVEEGAVVQSSTVVCILEAMKVMNEIKAGVAGTVAEILIENGQSVEFGQALFKIKKN